LWGEKPNGILVTRHGNMGILLTYDFNSEEQSKWVYKCEAKLRGFFDIWVSVNMSVAGS